MEPPTNTDDGQTQIPTSTDEMLEPLLDGCHIALRKHIEAKHNGEGITQGCDVCGFAVNDIVKVQLWYSGKNPETDHAEVEREIRSQYTEVTKSVDEDARYESCPQCQTRFFWATGVSIQNYDGDLKLFCSQECLNAHNKEGKGQPVEQNDQLAAVFTDFLVYATWPLKFTHAECPANVAAADWKVYFTQREVIADLMRGDLLPDQNEEESAAAFKEAVDTLTDMHRQIENMPSNTEKCLSLYYSEMSDSIASQFECVLADEDLHRLKVSTRDRTDRRWTLVVGSLDQAELYKVDQSLQDLQSTIDEQIDTYKHEQIAKRLANPSLPHNVGAACERCKLTLTVKDGYIVHTNGYFCSDCVPASMPLAKF